MENKFFIYSHCLVADRALVSQWLWIKMLDFKIQTNRKLSKAQFPHLLKKKMVISPTSCAVIKIK